MRHAAHEAARNFLDGFAEDIVNTNEADFENRLEEWTALGFPELAFYRGDRPRDRGEIIAEIRKAQRALDGNPRALAQATRDELPVLAGALRVAAQSLVETPGGQAEGESTSYPLPDHDSRFPDKWAARGWGGPRNPYQVPTINLGKDRVANILADRPARFQVKENPDANSGPEEDDDPWRGWHAVRENDALIEEAAEKYRIEPDLIRAVMWTENTRSNSGGRDEIFDFIRLADTTMPMNINREMWARLIDVAPGELREPWKNIEAGAALLRQITNRIEDPTPEKIGSVWNYSGRENVNDFGAHIGRVYEEKPWLGREPLRRGFKSETFP